MINMYYITYFSILSIIGFGDYLTYKYIKLRSTIGSITINDFINMII